MAGVVAVALVVGMSGVSLNPGPQTVAWGSLGYVMLPPSEGGNYSMELAHALAAHPKMVVMDDYEYGGPQAASVYSSLVAAKIPVCLVLYPFFSQPKETVGASCVILPIRPGEQIGSMGLQPAQPPETSLSGWLAIMRADMAGISAKNVHLLVYEAHTSFWSLPPPANYTRAAVQLSQQTGEWMVAWG
ncbi:MAG: hypothetical protein JRN50_02360 [Nitrososphaerota archaeon]|nr:hypothetical protein [Nitrososphaerota archaeon]